MEGRVIDRDTVPPVKCLQNRKLKTIDDCQKTPLTWQGSQIIDLTDLVFNSCTTSERLEGHLVSHTTFIYQVLKSDQFSPESDH